MKKIFVCAVADYDVFDIQLVTDDPYLALVYCSDNEQADIWSYDEEPRFEIKGFDIEDVLKHITDESLKKENKGKYSCAYLSQDAIGYRIKSTPYPPRMDVMPIVLAFARNGDIVYNSKWVEEIRKNGLPFIPSEVPNDIMEKI